ncbi:MAG: PAS domain S-box protein [Calditrichaeota bacterium]|nr:MAG: PAS domain S-box protein [Calditrichota bacterium]
MPKARILIVKENSSATDEIRNGLIANGYQICGLAANATEAQKYIQDFLPDLALIDIQLQDNFNGFDNLCHTGRQHDIPLVFLNNYADDKLLKMAKETDPFFYVLHPFEPGKLAIAVEMALYKHELKNILFESEQKYRMLAEQASDIIWVFDIETLRTTYVSAAVERILGYTVDEVLALHIENKMPPESFARVKNILQEELQNERKNDCDPDRTRTLEIEQFHKNGQKVSVEITCRFLRNELGEPTSVIGITRDVNERNQTLKSLAEKTTMLDNILRSANDIAIITTDLDFRIKYYNPIAEKFFSYKADQVINKTVQEIHEKECVAPERLERAIDQVQENGEYKYNYERETASGKQFIESRITGIYTPENQIIGYSLFSQDVTERKQAEKIMLKASRMEATSTLAAGIAHDFNNLMVGVLGNADLIKMQLEAEPEIDEMLDAIAKSARQAGELAQQLLFFARGGKYQPKILNFNSLLQQIFKRDKHIFPPRVRVSHKSDPHLWNIYADSNQMNQVVMNLCINAVEAIENHGTITITTKNVLLSEESALCQNGIKPGRFLLLSVEDSGSGMRNETLVKIFEPFFSTKFKGRGLGLAAAYGIIKNHEGHIIAESEPGQGTIFKIYIPATESEPEELDESSLNIPGGDETILVIDDESLILDISDRILTKFGYQVLLAHNGQEAIDIAKSFSGAIHLAILDLGMPILGGVDAFPLLRDAQPDMKVIICSGYELDDTARTLLNSGAVSFLQKPFQAEKLAIYVRQALDKQTQKN